MAPQHPAVLTCERAQPPGQTHAERLEDREARPPSTCRSQERAGHFHAHLPISALTGNSALVICPVPAVGHLPRLQAPQTPSTLPTGKGREGLPRPFPSPRADACLLPMQASAKAQDPHSEPGQAYGLVHLCLKLPSASVFCFLFPPPPTRVSAPDPQGFVSHTQAALTECVE